MNKRPHKHAGKRPFGNRRQAPQDAGNRTEGRGSSFRAPEGQDQDKRSSRKYEPGKRPFQGKPAEERDPDKRGYKKRGFGNRSLQEKVSEERNYSPGKFEKQREFGKRPFQGKRPEKRRFEERKPRPENSRPDIVRQDNKKPERDRNTVLIWGHHAVRAAWLNPKRRCLRLWLSESGQKAFEETLAAGRENLLKRPDAKHTERHELDRLTPPGSVHQGILLEVEPLHEPSLHDLIAGDAPPDCLIMLDQVTDPHNIGAILRSAAALGAGGVILTERNAPSMTGVLAKAASGAADHIPQVHVVNLSRALDELREAGYWCVGLAEEGEKNLDACDLSGRTVLVLGAEGEGLRQLTRKKCDELAKLPTGGSIGSLNVSNAAAVALYEAKRQKTRGKS